MIDLSKNAGGPEPSARFFLTDRESEQWIQQGSSGLTAGSDRYRDAALRAKLDHHFDWLVARDEFEDLSLAVRKYMSVGIPAPELSEFHWWALSCHTSPQVFYRLNVAWQEVFTAYADEDNTPIWTLFLARSPLTAAYGNHLSELHRDKVEATSDFYESGGQDQMRLRVKGLYALLTLLERQPIQLAIREFNLRLMKGRRCMQATSHCFALADLAIQRVSPETFQSSWAL